VDIEIRTRGFSPTPALRAYVERRLAFALDRHEERVAGVRVTLADVNGPRGGHDKSCRVDMRLRGGRTVRASALTADAYDAVATAVHRAARGVARALERERATTLELLWLARALS